MIVHYSSLQYFFIDLLHRHISKLCHCHSNNFLPFSLGPGVGYSVDIIVEEQVVELMEVDIPRASL